MEKKSLRNRLDKILNNAPALKEILFSSDQIDIKRKKLTKFLADMLIATFDDDPAIPPLEWILTRDAIQVFSNILSTRNESLAGFSLLQYINDLIHKENFKQIQMPSSGFFAELDHLIRGITGKTGVYPYKIPAPSEKITNNIRIPAETFLNISPKLFLIFPIIVYSGE